MAATRPAKSPSMQRVKQLGVKCEGAIGRETRKGCALTVLANERTAGGGSEKEYDV